MPHKAFPLRKLDCGHTLPVTRGTRCTVPLTVTVDLTVFKQYRVIRHRNLVLSLITAFNPASHMFPFSMFGFGKRDMRFRSRNINVFLKKDSRESHSGSTPVMSPIQTGNMHWLMDSLCLTHPMLKPLSCPSDICAVHFKSSAFMKYACGG